MGLMGLQLKMHTAQSVLFGKVASCKDAHSSTSHYYHILKQVMTRMNFSFDDIHL